MFTEHGTVPVGRDADRLDACGPKFARRGIAHEDKRTVRRQRRLRPPARDGHVAPAAEPFAGWGQHHAVIAVRQKMRGRRFAGGGSEKADGGRIALLNCGNQHFGGARRSTGHIARNAFLQQQFDTLNHRVRVEAVTQAAVLQGIGNRGDGHALMVRHETAHDGMGFVGMQS